MRVIHLWHNLILRSRTSKEACEMDTKQASDRNLICGSTRCVHSKRLSSQADQIMEGSYSMRARAHCQKTVSAHVPQGNSRVIMASWYSDNTCEGTRLWQNIALRHSISIWAHKTHEK